MSTLLPDHILRLMRAEDRALLGPAGRTTAAARLMYEQGEERRMHREFERWLAHHKDAIYWDHSRFGFKTTNRVGHPDFVLQGRGRVLNIEMKCAGARATAAQLVTHAWIERAGGRVHICRSSVEAIELARQTFLAPELRAADESPLPAPPL